jgi:hypothetical protein
MVKMHPRFQRDPTARHGSEHFRMAFGVVLNFCSSNTAPDSSNTQYQLDRSPRSKPMVNFCSEIFLLAFAATVLTFFIAGLLYLLRFKARR